MITLQISTEPSKDDLGSFYCKNKIIFQFVILEKFIQQFGEENKHLAMKEGKNSSSGLAAWFVSNCATYSGREDFVEKLRKYFPVDIYGHTSCSNLRCRDQNGKCMEMVNRTYKVGFDNNIYVNSYEMIQNIPVLPLIGEFSLQGLHHREVLQDPSLQCDPNSAECCQHD